MSNSIGRQTRRAADRPRTAWVATTNGLAMRWSMGMPTTRQQEINKDAILALGGSARLTRAHRSGAREVDQ